METRNLLIQIALLILGGIIVFKVFQMDTNQKIIKNSINSALGNVEDAQKNLDAAQEEITKLEGQIRIFKNEQKILEAQKDSIVLNYRRVQSQEREELEEIKEKIEEDIAKNSKELERLRKLNEQFVSGGGPPPPKTETSLKLRNFIKEASDELRKRD